jgi:DNA replication and repair protein RecF
MIINSLKLTNFRNFAKYELRPDRVTILVGPNGVGKTNIVEAIFLLSVCRSYRTRRDAEVIKWGENVARVAVESKSDAGDELKIAVAQDGDKKIAFAGDKPVPVSLLVGRLPTVVFAPEIMELPVDLPAKRRRQLDILASQVKPSYTQLLLGYHRILKARNKLLDGIAYGRNRPGELEFWDKELVKCGQQILTQRNDIILSLNEVLNSCFQRINNTLTKGERMLRFEYMATITDTACYTEELAAAKERDLRYRNTTVGPHRDDWHLLFDNVDIRVAASRGETRAALLAFKMAEMAVLRAQRGEVPVLLLDDVFAELDKHHSEALLDFIGDAQTIVTATDAEYIPKSFKDKAKIVELQVES